MILIIGGTGVVGRELVDRLLQRGEQVRLLARDPGKARERKQDGAEVVQGDLADTDSLGRALDGVKSVFLLSPADPEMPELHANLYGAAQLNHWPHVVRLSALGADPESPLVLGRIHGRADQRLIDSGNPYTILRPAYFMQNLLWFHSSIVNQDAFYAPLGDGAISMIDVRDIAEVAAAALTEIGHRGEAYELTGPEAISMPEVALRITEALERRVRYEPISTEEARHNMLSVGFPEWTTDALLELYEALAGGGGARTTETVARILGRGPTSIDTFLEDFAQAFRVRRVADA